MNVEKLASKLLSVNLEELTELVHDAMFKEVKDAIEGIITEEQEDSNEQNAIGAPRGIFDFTAVPEAVEATYSDILKYWRRDEDDRDFSTYYGIGFREKNISGDDNGYTGVIAAQETRTFNIAVKTNYHARLKNELGLDSPDLAPGEDENARNFAFKILNPGLWKFMYDASSFLMFSCN